MIICNCYNVNLEIIEALIKQGNNVDDIIRITNMCTDCGTCRESLEIIYANIIMNEMEEYYVPKTRD